MDFIEQIFGVSPDGGNGSLELLYVLSIAAAIALVSYRLYRRGANRQMRSLDQDTKAEVIPMPFSSDEQTSRRE
jgi:hypothetical protein